MDDEYEGMGGSYVVNPKTGKRKLVERTANADHNTIAINDAADYNSAEEKSSGGDDAAANS